MWCTERKVTYVFSNWRSLTCVTSVCILHSTGVQMHLPMWDVSQQCLLGRESDSSVIYKKQWVKQVSCFLFLKMKQFDWELAPLHFHLEADKVYFGAPLKSQGLCRKNGLELHNEETSCFLPLLFSQNPQQCGNHWGCRYELTWPFIAKTFCPWCPLNKIWHILLVLSPDEFMGRHPHLGKTEQNNQNSWLPFMPCGENAFGDFQLLFSAGSMGITDRVLLEHILVSKQWLQHESKGVVFWSCFCL